MDSYGPLEGLLSAHGESYDGLEVRDFEFFCEQLMDGFDIVANRHHRETRPVIRLRSVAGRRRMPIAKQLSLVLFEGLDPHKAVPELMMRDPKHELEGISDE